MGVEADDPEVQKLLASQTPIIGVDIQIAGPRASYVTSDNVTGARLAVRHLHGLGHRRIATISGRRGTKAGDDRTLGYRAAMHELGLDTVDPDRERRLREALAAANGGPLSAAGLDRLVSDLLDLTKRELGS